MVEEIKANYELAIVYRLTDGQTEPPAKAIEVVKDLLAGLDSQILKEDVWGLRQLAYKIKHQSQGFYVFYEIFIDGQKIKNLEKSLNINEAILRYLVSAIDYRRQEKAAAIAKRQAERQKPEEVEVENDSMKTEVLEDKKVKAEAQS